MFAVIQTGGKQYLVQPGDKLHIEKLDAKEGDVFTFDQVLLVSDHDEVKIGTPILDGVRVEAKIIQQARARKVIIFKYRPKARSRKKRGHRQYFTEVEIMGIQS